LIVYSNADCDEGINDNKDNDADVNKAAHHPYWCKSTENGTLPLIATVKSFAPVLLVTELMFSNVMLLSIIVAIFR